MSSYLDTSMPWSASELGLDARLQKAVSRQGYTYPTLIQAKVIPLALGGKDCLIRAATGSGKTAAYGLVILQQLLVQKLSSRGVGGVGGSGSGASSQACVSALVLVPTRELVDQTLGVLTGLAHYCTDVIALGSLGGSKDGSGGAKGGRGGGGRALEGVDIVVSTPSRAAAHVRAGTLTLNGPTGSGSGSGSAAAAAAGSKGCTLLVVDEADLCLSYGHEGDVVALVGALPRGFQALMLSATLSPALDALKRVVLHSPAIVKLEEGPGGGSGGPGGGVGGLTHFYLRTPTADKYLAAVTLFRLKLIAGRTIVFTNSIETCYRLKLLLDKFGVVSATLNAELPLRSRASVIEQYNKGIFDILIATDEALEEGEEEEEEEGEGEEGEGEGGDREFEEVLASKQQQQQQQQESGGAVAGGGKKRVRIAEGSGGGGEEESGAAAAPAPQKGKRKRGEQDTATTTTSAASASAPSHHLDTTFAPSRGLDFKGVTTVLNFDFPLTKAGYEHRVGRTARGGASGVALSLLPPQGVDPKADGRLAKLEKKSSSSSSSGGGGEGGEEGSSSGLGLTPLPFDLKEVEGFRYRVEDTLRGLTSGAIGEARMEELRREALASASLAGYWEDHPAEKTLLAHARPLGKGRRSGHLKTVPTYLLPSTLRAALEEVGAGVGVGMGGGGGGGGEGKKKGRGGGAGGGGKKDRGKGGPPSVGGVAGRGGAGKAMDPLKAFVLNMGRDKKARVGR